MVDHAIHKLGDLAKAHTRSERTTSWKSKKVATYAGLCGMERSLAYMTTRWADVTCRNCINRREK